MAEFFDTSVQAGAVTLFSTKQGDAFFNSKSVSNQRSFFSPISQGVLDYNAKSPGIVVRTSEIAAQRFLGNVPEMTE